MDDFISFIIKYYISLIFHTHEVITRKCKEGAHSAEILLTKLFALQCGKISNMQVHKTDLFKVKRYGLISSFSVAVIYGEK